MTAPSEAQIVEAVTAKLTGSQGKTVPEAELVRLLATLELENDWTDVSAKRFHSVLSKNALVDSPSTATTATSNGEASTGAGTGGKKKKKSKTDAGVPRSYIDANVSIPPGVRAHYFDAVKGKGLVASRSFAEGELVFTEEAYIATPPPEAFDQVSSGELCAQCFLPVSSAPVQLAIKNCAKCKMRWCTSACARTAMATHHTLLCPGLNPAAKPLVQLVQSQKWQSLHCVARSLARLLSTLTPHNNGTASGKQSREQDDLIAAYGDFETVHARLSSFATVSELERRSRNPGWATEKASFEGILAQAYTALCNALDPYADARTSAPHPDPHHVQLDLIDAVKTRKGQIKDLFTYASFLKLLGRANVNMEKFGGLYSVHSFLNHSCAPNVQIRHVPERGILASMKVAALALRPIAKDEELVISYIDPSTRLGRRQLVLYRDYCFGPCTCPKCKQELNEVGLQYDPAKNSVKTFLDSVARKSNPDPQAQAAQDPSLEEELRASLGF